MPDRNIFINQHGETMHMVLGGFVAYQMLMQSQILQSPYAGYARGGLLPPGPGFGGPPPPPGGVGGGSIPGPRKS
jgi:hypothetical protein